MENAAIAATPVTSRVTAIIRSTRATSGTRSIIKKTRSGIKNTVTTIDLREKQTGSEIELPIPLLSSLVADYFVSIAGGVKVRDASCMSN